MERGRRLRRARALRDNVPYRLEIPPVVDLGSVQVALSEITQALGTASSIIGKILYAIQQATSLIKYRAKLEATQSETMKGAKEQAHADHNSRIQEYPGFELEFGINAGTDINAETDWTLRKAEEEAGFRQGEPMPTPPPGMRPGSAQYRIYREEAYQALRYQIGHLTHELREYHEMKRQDRKVKEGDAFGDPSPRASCQQRINHFLIDVDVITLSSILRRLKHPSGEYEGHSYWNAGQDSQCLVRAGIAHFASYRTLPGRPRRHLHWMRLGRSRPNLRVRPR
jgi:hypothetical protein